MTLKVRRTRSISISLFSLWLSGFVILGGMQIEISHQFQDRSLTCGDLSLKTSGGDTVSITRLDYLLSDFALQRAGDGIWESAGERQGYVSVASGRQRVTLPGLPKGQFSALRFTVGVNPDINAADPNQYPAEHPLNPQVNGLHWGWQGGYVFLALEGHYVRGKESEPGGYSYHLANDANATKIELPIQFDGKSDRTIQLKLDVAQLFDGPSSIIIAEHGDSTHSRDRDPLPIRLKSNLQQAFSFVSTSSDTFHETAVKAVPTVFLGTAYPLRVSKRFPQVTLPEDNPLTIEGVRLGERLFQDPRISKNNVQSCASCHQQSHAFTDPNKRFSIGANGDEGRRNAMPLFNLAWKKAFFWDGRVERLRDQVLMPIQDPHEMNESLPAVLTKLKGDDRYLAMFKAAFGEAAIGEKSLAMALEQFLFSLVSQDSKFDRAARGETRFTTEEQRGLQLFVTEFDPTNNLRGADCFHCHSGNLFTNHAFANNGLDAHLSDLGLGKVTGRDSDAGKFATPSLRNVSVTGPYMHDGRFATLTEVINHYDSGVKHSATLDPNLAKHPDTGLELTEADKQSLIAFLNTLTDDRFLKAEEAKSLTLQ